MNQPELTFDGVADTLTERDGARLQRLHDRVLALMSDARWRTYDEIRAMAGGSESGVGARLRDFIPFPRLG